MGLSIHTEPARFDIQVTRAKLEWETTNAQLDITQKPPLVRIETELPLLKIDQYECFAEEGLKNNYDLMKEQVQRAYQNVMEYIAKKAEDGDAMKRIGHKANIMLDIIKRDSITQHEFGMVTIPQSRPKVELTGGTVKLYPEDNNKPGEINGVSGQYTPGHIDFRYTPWNVDVRMLSYGSVDITYTGNNVDQSV